MKIHQDTMDLRNSCYLFHPLNELYRQCRIAHFFFPSFFLPLALFLIPSFPSPSLLLFFYLRHCYCFSISVTVTVFLSPSLLLFSFIPYRPVCRNTLHCNQLLSIIIENCPKLSTCFAVTYIGPMYVSPRVIVSLVIIFHLMWNYFSLALFIYLWFI
jgi:hypothetical protein